MATPLQRTYLLFLFQGFALAQTPSSISLIASPSPSSYGQPVTLTATVPSGATGKVTFYDGVAILGVGTISGAQASIATVMLRPGKRSLRAYYQGNGAYAASSSPSIAQTVVAGSSLGFNKAISYPGGAASSVTVADFNGDNRLDFVELALNGTITVYLGNGDGTFHTGSPSDTLGPYGASELAVGDFNGDGRIDLAIPNFYNSSVSIMLGNGDGTFQQAVSYPAGGYPTSVTAADFNGDGKADLLVTEQSGANAAILLGSGDGTFQSPSYASIGAGIATVSVADFNNDDKADLAAVSGSSTVVVLMGNGDGSFQAPVTIQTGAEYTYSIVTTDVNGDGYIDLLVDTGSSIGVLLGTGLGTFLAPLPYTIPYGSTFIVADFNGDGKPDLALANFGTLAIAPGNGDGTFGVSISYQIPNGVDVPAAGDFNGDGITDLIFVGESTYDIYAVMLGGAIPDLAITASHGTGLTEGQQGATYTITVSNLGGYATSGTVQVAATLPAGLTATSAGGAGWTCVPATLTCTRSDWLAPSGTYSAIVLLVSVAGGLTGDVTSTFTVSGGGDKNVSNNSVSDTTFSRYISATALAAAPNPSILGQDVMLTATVTNGASGRVDFYDSTVPLGSAAVANAQATLTTWLLPSGGNALQAIYGGDSSYGPSVSPTLSQAVAPLAENGMQPYSSYTTGGGAIWIGAADVNGDRNVDLITANNTNEGNISVLLGNGAGTFGAAQTFGVSPIQAPVYPYSAAIADFNNDGKPDVMVGGAGLYLMLGNGDGTFAAGIAVSSSAQVTTMAAADFNGDGNPDLLVLGNGISLYLGKGDGTFQAPLMLTLTPSGASYAGLAVADMNGDGIPDFVTLAYSGFSGGPVNIVLGNGDGTFQPPKTVDYTFGGVLAVGDFNGDGKPDVAFVNSFIEVMLGNGDGTLQAPLRTTLNPVITATSAITGDFNGDGKLDLAFPGYGFGSVAMAFGNGDGTFQPGPLLSTNGPGVIVAGDFNREGRQDFAFGANNYTTLQVFLGGLFPGLSVASAHAGTFITAQTGIYQLTVTDSAFASTSGTVTVKDTLPNGLTATTLGGNGWNCTLASFSCSRSDGIGTGGSFPAITLTVNVANTLPAGVIDNQVSVSYGGVQTSGIDPTTIVLYTTTSLTGSPNPSSLGHTTALTAVVTAGATGTVMFLDNGGVVGTAAIVNGQAILSTPLLPAGLQSLIATYSGDGSHAPSSSNTVSQTVNAAPATGFTLPAIYPTGAAPSGIAMADFNLDGKPDLVTVNSTANTISVLLGKGDGTFASRTDYAVGTHPSAIVIADFNSDGIPDIAAASEGGQSVSILLGRGDGTFQPGIGISLGEPVYFLVVSDFNGDGRADLMVIAQIDTWLLIGKGDGTFRPPVDIDFNSASSAVVGDFNRDGRIDIVTSAGTLLLENGDGTFTSSNIAGLDNSLEVDGDLTGDGKLDFVTNSTVLLGNGDGTFQSASYPSTNQVLGSLLLADVNGDGRLDLVTSGYPYSVGILLGNGDGTLQPAAFIAPGTGSQYVVAGDFNGDGLTDLAIADSGSNTISVLLGAYGPVLHVTSSHSDPFYLGQTGATFTISVANNGPGTTSGAVTLAETLASGLTAAGIAGDGWSCTLASLTCTNSNVLPAGQSYAPITVTVNVTATSIGQISTAVKVSGIGDIPATTADTTNVFGATITLQTIPAGLQVLLGNHPSQPAPQTVNLSPGLVPIGTLSPQTGPPGTQYVFTGWSDSGAEYHNITVGTGPATYSATFKTQYQLTTTAFPQTGGAVTPNSGTYYDSGSPVTLTAAPNSPLVFTGWSNGATANPLPISMNAPTSVTAYFDIPGATCTMTGDTTPSIADVQFMVNEALGIVPANNDLNADGVVNIADIQKAIGAALNFGCR